MTIIKVIFVILLLIPIGALLRHLLGRLSAEEPKQADSIDMSPAPKKAKNPPAGRKMTGNKGKRRTVKEPAPAREEPAPTGKTGTYTPRQPEEWHRSDRVPFGESEGFRVPVPESRRRAQNNEAKQWKKPSDAVREREISANTSSDRLNRASEVRDNEPEKAPETKAKKRKNRSEKSPTKRQLRKNRQRARKRDIKRRKEDEKRG